MTVRDHLGRSLAVGSALAVLGVGAMTMTERALAVAPPPTPGATNALFPYTNTTPQSIGPVAGTLTESSITVPQSGPSVLTDIDVLTRIAHTASGDLDIELRAPNGTTVKLVAGPHGARGTDDVFDGPGAGTLWDDSELTLASDLDSQLLPPEAAPQAALAPEGSLAKFIGIDPRGVWTLRVTDEIDAPDDNDPATPAPDGGTLKSWGLNITSQTPAPPAADAAQTFNTGASSGLIATIPAAPTTSSLTVAGLKGYLRDVDLVTNITHTNPGELDLVLTHGSRSVVISTGSDGSTSFFTNRTFNDSATGLVSDGGAGELIPEGALGAFIGMDPNGVWQLSAIDSGGVSTGTLDGFSLKIRASEGAPVVVPPPVTPPVVTPPVVTPPVTPPVVTPQATKLGLKRFGLVKNAKKGTLKLNVAWLNGTGRVNYTATLSTKLGKKTVRKVVKGSGVAGPKAVSKTVKIPKTWKGKKVTVRLVVKNSGTSLVRTKTIRRF